MPTYDYVCDDCGGFEAFQSMAHRNEAVACPHCGKPSQRSWAVAPRLALLETSTRLAYDVNERARHEPKRSGEYTRLRHPAGCSCCKTSSQRGTQGNVATGAPKMFPSKRPWMISH
jgi:putative FmdB family regulatory protein